MLLLDNIGGDLLQSVLLAIVPLASISASNGIDDATGWHINHQFTVLYGRDRRDQNESVKKGDDIRRNSNSSQNLVLELRAYLRQNFGLTSMAGCGTVSLPTDPGTYDILVKTW